MNLALPESDLPVRLRFDRPITDGEFMRFCAQNELLRVEKEPNGELVVMSSTGAEGSGWNLEIGVELALWARSEGRGKVFDSNGGFKLPDGSVRAADAAWLSWTRWDALTPEEKKGFAPVCPEFVIELRSPSDRLPDLRAKMEQWIANGAELAWLIDPERKAVEIYLPGAAPEIQEGHTAAYGEGPVGGFVLELARIWQ